MTQPKIQPSQIQVGTSANEIVQLDGSARIPAVNGSLLTNVDAATLGGQPVGSGALDIVQRDGSGNNDADLLGGQPVGTGANDIVALNGSSQLPAVDGSLLTGVTAAPSQPDGAAVTRSTGAFTFGLTNNSRSIVDWDEEIYDTASLHSTVTNPSRINVPSGVTRVRLRAMIAFTSNINGQRTARFRKTGSTTLMTNLITGAEVWGVANDIPSLAISTLQLQTPVITCTDTDYFEVEAGIFNATGWSDGVNGVVRNSFFELIVIE